MKKLYFLTAILCLMFSVAAMDPPEVVSDIHVATLDGDVFQTYSAYLNCSDVLEMLKTHSNPDEPLAIGITSDAWALTEVLLQHAFAIKSNEQGALVAFENYLQSQSDEIISVINELQDYLNISYLEESIFVKEKVGP